MAKFLGSNSRIIKQKDKVLCIKDLPLILCGLHLLLSINLLQLIRNPWTCELHLKENPPPVTYVVSYIIFPVTPPFALI
jgi:hypothetical protein